MNIAILFGGSSFEHEISIAQDDPSKESQSLIARYLYATAYAEAFQHPRKEDYLLFAKDLFREYVRKNERMRSFLKSEEVDPPLNFREYEVVLAAANEFLHFFRAQAKGRSGVEK